MKNNNSNGTNGMHNTNKIINDALPLTWDHQVQIGTPRGIINLSNPNGYSAFQRKLIGSLHRIESIIVLNSLKSIKRKRSTVPEMILLDFQIGWLLNEAMEK